MRKTLFCAISVLTFLTTVKSVAEEPKYDYQVHDIIKQYLPNIDIKLPDQLSVQKYKELHWHSKQKNYNWYSDVLDQDFTMKFQHENSTSVLNYDDGWSYNWSFKWTGNLFNKP